MTWAVWLHPYKKCMYIQSSSHDYFNSHSVSEFYELTIIRAAGNMVVKKNDMVSTFKEFTVFSWVVDLFQWQRIRDNNEQSLGFLIEVFTTFPRNGQGITNSKYHAIVALKQPGSTHEKCVYNFSRTAVVRYNSRT